MIEIDATNRHHNTDRARGLARLLIYALLDATDLGSNSTAVSVRSAIEQLKVEYGLKDHEILQH